MKVLFKRHLKGCFHCYRNTAVRTQSLAMFQTLISIDNTVKMLRTSIVIIWNWTKQSEYQHLLSRLLDA